MACPTRYLRDVDIRAVWDGVQDHAVNVDLCIQLECRPHTRVLILDQAHKLVESASVARVRHITPSVHEEAGNVDDAQASGEIGNIVWPLDMDAFSPLDAEGLVQWNRQLAAKHQSQLAMLYRDITSFESFSPVVAAERWREIKDIDVAPLAVTESGSIGEDDRVRDGLSSAAVMENERPISTQHPSPLTLSVSKRGQRIARTDRRRGADVAVSPLRKRSRSLGSGGSLFEESVRPPRIPQGNDVKPDQGTCSVASREPLRRTAGQRARSQSETHRHVHGVCDWMCSGGSDLIGALAKAPPHSPNQQNIEAGGSALKSKNELFPEATERQTCVPVAGTVASCVDAQRSEDLDISVSQILERWETPRKAERSNITVQSLETRHVAPDLVEEDGKLYVVCGESTTGTYEIDIKAKIRLSILDAQHHQSFCIPGLIRAEVAQDRMPTGSFAFYFEPTVNTPDGWGMRFGSEALMDYHLKESSHIIGRFRLDESPLISIRTKKPVHCISEFSVSVDACAAFLPSSSSGIRRLYYNARLLCEVDEKDVWADEVELFIVVRHGSLGDAQYQVDNGRCVALHNTLLLTSGAKESETLISVMRNTEDVHGHLDISFSIPIDVSSPTEIFLPTLRPLFGKVLSESIILSLPRLPLKLEHIQNDSHTRWKVLQSSKAGHKYMRFDRLPIPDTLPQFVDDNPQFKVSELVRVKFRSLTTMDQTQMDEISVSVARNLQVSLFQISDGLLGCQIDVEVQIGTGLQLLTIDSQGWVPSFSFVNGRLATQGQGEWRETDDAVLDLFNTRDMRAGKVVHITFFFEQLCCTPILEDYVNIEQDSEDGRVEKPLPKIVGMTILQAHMRLEVEDCTILLSNPPESRVTRFSRSRGHSEMRLPILTSDYHFSFIRDTAKSATCSNEVVKLESPPNDEEEPFVIIDTPTCGPVEDEQDKLQQESKLQAQDKSVGFNQETPDILSVMTDKASLGEQLAKMTAEIEKSKHCCAASTSWSSRSLGSKLVYCLTWYVCLPLYIQSQGYNAGIYFNGLSPLIPLRDALWSRPNRTECIKQSALDGYDSKVYASGNKLAGSDEIGNGGQGKILSDHVDGQGQREEDTGVLDWIDYALGWRG
ncbi:hypothetical protein MMC26_003776 [Xylographa opegraphella]|nr:hypothetical protein [Xylographa opegraphella]